jgi:hypothetical protein
VSDGHVLDVLANYTAVTPHVRVRGLRPSALPSSAPGGVECGICVDEAAVVDAAYGSREVVRRKVWTV